MKKFGDLLVVIVLIMSIIVGCICAFLSFVTSAIVMKYTAHVVVVLIILELCAVTTFGIGTVLLYGILTYIGAFIVLFITTILTAFFMAK